MYICIYIYIYVIPIILATFVNMYSCQRLLAAVTIVFIRELVLFKRALLSTLGLCFGCWAPFSVLGLCLVFWRFVWYVRTLPSIPTPIDIPNPLPLRPQYRILSNINITDIEHILPNIDHYRQNMNHNLPFSKRHDV